MAENGNGFPHKTKPTFPSLITKEEMVSAFELAKALGVEEEFGSSSPLGGIVVLLQELNTQNREIRGSIGTLQKMVLEIYKEA